jgi:hypothetical protein
MTVTLKTYKSFMASIFDVATTIKHINESYLKLLVLWNLNARRIVARSLN